VPATTNRGHGAESRQPLRDSRSLVLRVPQPIMHRQQRELETAGHAGLVEKRIVRIKAVPA
jgi:hypothetical protein